MAIDQVPLVRPAHLSLTLDSAMILHREEKADPYLALRPRHDPESVHASLLSLLWYELRTLPRISRHLWQRRSATQAAITAMPKAPSTCIPLRAPRGSVAIAAGRSTRGRPQRVDT